MKHTTPTSDTARPLQPSQDASWEASTASDATSVEQMAHQRHASGLTGHRLLQQRTSLSPQPLAFLQEPTGAVASPDSAASQAIASRGVAGSGRALDGTSHTRFRSSTGVDVAQAREHTGPDAQAACATLGVQAYTLGDRIAYSTSQPSDHVRFHELTHVAQNTSGVQTYGGRGALEANADAVAAAVMAGRQATVASGGQPLAYLAPNNGNGDRTGDPPPADPNAQSDEAPELDPSTAEEALDSAVQTLPERASIEEVAQAIQAQLEEKYKDKGGYRNGFAGYGSGTDRYVCTTFVSKVLKDAGYTIDRETEAKIQIAGLPKDWKTMLDQHSDDERLRGVAFAITSSGQGLDVPVEESAPAKHLRPGDVMQWWHAGGGHATMVDSTLNDTHVTLIGSHKSKKGITTIEADLSLPAYTVIAAARPFGSPHFAELVALRQEMGLPNGGFVLSADGQTVVKTSGGDLGDDVETPKPKPKAKPAPSHAEMESALAASHEGALDSTTGMDAEALDAKKAWDHGIRDYRDQLKNDPDEVSARRQQGIAETTVSAAKRQTDLHHAHEADAESELDAKKPWLFPNKSRDRRRRRMEHLGLLGREAKPAALVGPQVDAHGDVIPGDKALIVERVGQWVNQLYFNEGMETLERRDIEAMTAELTERFLAGRAAQQALAEVAAYWRHFQVEKLSRQARKALKDSDPEGFQAYKEDRKLTRKVRFQHSTVNDALRTVTGRAKQPHKSPSPDTIASLVGAGEQGPERLEPWIRAQQPKGPEAARQGSGFEGGLDLRADTIQNLVELEQALMGALQPLGLSALPGMDAVAPELRMEPAPHMQAADAHVEAADEAPEELRASAVLTVVFKRLVELVLGIHAQPDPMSPRLRELRAGDRVPVTAERREQRGTVWAQALVDAPHSGGARRLGWVDTTFTNEARGETGADRPCTEQTPSQTTLVGETPVGLTVTGYLRPVRDGVPIPVWGSVYDRERTVGQIGGGEDRLALVGQTADNDPELVEVLLGDRPVYAPRVALREADPEERMIHLETLTVAEIQQCRAYATTIADPVTRAAFYAALQRKPMFLDASRSTVHDTARRGPLTSLAMALEVLGVPMPYAEAHSYADALEMIRLEQGLPEALDANGVEALVVAFGIGVQDLETDEVQDALTTGRAVLVCDGQGRVCRAVGPTAEGMEVDDPLEGRRVVPAGALETCVLLGLSVSVGVDQGTEERRNPALSDADAVEKAFKTQVYKGTDLQEEAWYLDKSDKVHGAEVTGALRQWLPTAQEVAPLGGEAQRKAFRTWMQRKGQGLAGLAEVKRSFVTPLVQLGGSCEAMLSELDRNVTRVLRRVCSGRPSASSYNAALAEIARAVKLGLLNEADAQAWRAKAESLQPKPTEPTPTDDDFAQLWRRDAPKATGGGSRPEVRGMIDYSRADDLTITTSDKEFIPFKTTCTVRCGNITLVYRWTGMTSAKDTANRWLMGWVLHSSTIDGRAVATTGEGHGNHWALIQEALGLSDAEMDLYRGKAATESGELGHMVVQTYDQMLLTVGAHGLAAADYGYQQSLVANVFGLAMRHDPQGDIKRTLASAGIRVKPSSGKAENAKAFYFEVDADDGQTYSEREDGTDAQVRSILKAYGRDPMQDAEKAMKATGRTAERDRAKANVERVFYGDRHISAKGKSTSKGRGHNASNMPQLVMRYDMNKIAALNILMSDPRIQVGVTAHSANAVRKDYVSKALVGDHAAFDYIWSPLSRYCYAYTSNHIRKNADIFVEAFDDIKAQFPDVQLEDPKNWNQAIEDAFRAAYAPKAKKANGKTLADLIATGHGHIGQLSAKRPTAKPADSGALIDTDAAMERATALMYPGDKDGKAQALTSGEQHTGDNDPAAAPRMGVLDMVRIVRVTEDPAMAQRLDAVYATEAGQRNLDAYCEPIFARLDDPARRLLGAATDKACALESWTARITLFAQWAAQLGDAEAIRGLMQALKVAIDVAEAYPNLGKPGTEQENDNPEARRDSAAVQVDPSRAAQNALENYGQFYWISINGDKLNSGRANTVASTLSSHGVGYGYGTGYKAGGTGKLNNYMFTATGDPIYSYTSVSRKAGKGKPHKNADASKSFWFDHDYKDGTELYWSYFMSASDRPRYLKESFDKGSAPKFSYTKTPHRVPEPLYNLDLKFIPGGASCTRTTLAMMMDLGSQGDGRLTAGTTYTHGGLGKFTFSKPIKGYTHKDGSPVYPIDYIDKALEMGRAIHVRTNGGWAGKDALDGHSMLIHGRSGNTYQINDPGSIHQIDLVLSSDRRQLISHTTDKNGKKTRVREVGHIYAMPDVMAAFDKKD